MWLSLNEGACGYGGCFIFSLFWSVSSLHFETGQCAPAHLLSQGTQGFPSFMSSRWSCRSCPQQQQCDLCSTNSPFVPWTSIPCQIEAYRTHRFYGEWRKMYAWVWVYVLWLLILTSRSHSPLVLRPHGAQGLDVGVSDALQVTLKSTKLRRCSEQRDSVGFCNAETSAPLTRENQNSADTTLRSHMWISVAATKELSTQSISY